MAIAKNAPSSESTPLASWNARPGIRHDQIRRARQVGFTEAYAIGVSLVSPLQRRQGIDQNEPYCTWKLGGEYRSAISFVITLCFHDERLIRVDLTHVDPKYGTSWSDWSEEKEAQRKAEHDRWLQGHLGFEAYLRLGKGFLRLRSPWRREQHLYRLFAVTSGTSRRCLPNPHATKGTTNR